MWREMGYDASVGKTRVSLSLALPVVELTVWAVLVPAQIFQIWLGAHGASSRSTAHVSGIELTQPPDQWVPFALR